MAKFPIYTILQGRFTPDQYALMAEVSDKAGHSRSRSADFVAVSLWPSRGLGITGFELKSSRSDWLSELKNPGKAENIFQYCDYFYLLTDGEGIAKMEEIPPTWGWINIKGGKTFVLKEAPFQTCAPVTRHFMAAMLKRAVCKKDFVHIDSIEDRIEAAKQSQDIYLQNEIRRAEIKIQELEKVILEFETESGLKIRRRWDNADLGKSVKFVRDGGTIKMIKELQQLEVTAQNTLTKIKEALQYLPKEDQVTQNPIIQ
jgi:hypothetical protein